MAAPVPDIAPLCSTGDRFSGVLVDPTQLPVDVPEFEERLQASLNAWTSAGNRGVWLRLPIEKAAFVPVAVKHGFAFHHAEPTYVMMTRWLPVSEPSMLPEYASHTVGVGGFVLDDRNRVLVVAERFADKPQQWKLPGGYVKPGETFANAVVREVREECGIDSQFVSVMCFRHFHPLQFDKSDIYFVCRLKPLTFDIKLDPGEILDCKWMPIEEYVSEPNVTPMNRTVAQRVFDSISSAASASGSSAAGVDGAAQDQPLHRAGP
eukprot:TRINITY_DN15012_c0_g1_i1.p1 TRINITY_DN15012_c0_g1~~TRINITY_DN15012_c0_g1_i1.p1  ORF type:complete len:264 (+),score=50.82 TRINITY_DN15012_c0_g1_i1:110-901(+)